MVLRRLQQPILIIALRPSQTLPPIFVGRQQLGQRRPLLRLYFSRSPLLPPIRRRRTAIMLPEILQRYTPDLGLDDLLLYDVFLRLWVEEAVVLLLRDLDEVILYGKLVHKPPIVAQAVRRRRLGFKAVGHGGLLRLFHGVFLLLRLLLAGLSRWWRNTH